MRFLPLAVAVASAAAVFARTIAFPFLHWDDPLHVLENPFVDHPFSQGFINLFTTSALGYPVPVVVLSFALDRWVFGFNAVAFHLVNVLLHIWNVAAVFLFAQRLRFDSGRAGRVALLFALHPLAVEPVCWVTGRKDLLATALLLGALIILSNSRDRFPSLGRWLVIEGLAALAVLAKPSAVIAPILIWLVARHLYSWDRGRLARALAPLALFSCVLVVIGVRGEYANGSLYERSVVGAVYDVLGALSLQLWHLIAPWDLLAAYIREVGDPSNFTMVAALGCTVAALWFTFTRTPVGSPMRLGVAFALAAYLPVTNIVPVQRWVSDSYMYLPMVGLAITVIAFGTKYWPDRFVRTSVFLWPLLAGTMAFASVLHSDTWSESTKLWPPVIARYPNRPVPLSLLGRALLFEKRAEDSAWIFRRLREQFPMYDDDLEKQADAYALIGQNRRALAVLERGVLRGSIDCALRYWQVLIATSGNLSVKRDIAAAAFRMALPLLPERIHSPLVFERMAIVLNELGLPDYAARAAELGSKKQRK